METCLAILAFFAVASLIDPQSFLTVAGRSLEVAKHNLNQWVLLIAQQKTVPEKVNTEVKVEQKEERVIVPRAPASTKLLLMPIEVTPS